MKIVYLGAGAAGRFCGTCLHDNTLAAALSRRGEDVVLVPAYTPIRTDEENVSQSRVFFGGVNVYLQEKAAIFRHTPWFVDALFDSPRLLSWLSKRSASMEASKLGALTVSTLEGENGRQRKELEKLVQWLEHEGHPDVVHLSNAMLVGAARQIRQRLGVPIVCTLAGEDIFIEQLQPPHYEQARELLRRRAANVDAFIALNHYFADYMSDYLAVDRSKIQVIRHGLNLAGHGTRTAQRDGGVVTIGYFARVAAEKGLHLLVEAFALLAADRSLPPLRLKVAGYMSGGDRPYFEAITKRIAETGLGDRFEYVGELDREQKIAFLQSLDMMSVPTVYHESKGISVLEAMANAVPLVLPNHGTFPELIADTGGGLICPADDPPALAAALKRLILNPAEADELGRRGQQAIHARYTADVMADETAALYRRVSHRDGAAGSAPPTTSKAAR